MDKKKKSARLLKVIKIDPSLDERYLDKGYFQDKVDKANHILKTVGLPKGIKL